MTAPDIYGVSQNLEFISVLLLAAVNIYVYFDAVLFVLLVRMAAAAGIAAIALVLLRLGFKLVAVYIDVQFNTFFILVVFHDHFSFPNDVLRKANRFTSLYRICTWDRMCYIVLFLYFLRMCF